MKPAAVVLGVKVLGLIWPASRKGNGEAQVLAATPSDDPDPTLERTIESNVRVLAESVRRAERLERLFGPQR